MTEILFARRDEIDTVILSDVIRTDIAQSFTAGEKTQALTNIGAQPLDADLTTWASLTPSANAQSLVTAADYAAMRALLDLEAGTDFYSISAANAAFQPLDADLTTWAGLTPSVNAQSLVTAADYAAMRALLDLEVGTDFYSIAAANAAFQPLDADLTTWAGVTPGTGVAAALALDIGSAGAPVLFNGDAGTPSALVGTNITGTAAGLTAGNVTTNANLTGPITSSGNATSVAAQTGTGSTFVMQASPTLTTPVLGVATATSINKVALTAPATGSTLTIADGKTLTANETMTLTAVTGSNTYTFPTASGTVATLNESNVFTNTANEFNSAGNTKVTIKSTFSNSTSTGLDIDTTGDSSAGLLLFLKSGVSRGGITYSHSAVAANESLSFQVAGGSDEVTITNASVTVVPPLTVEGVLLAHYAIPATQYCVADGSTDDLTAVQTWLAAAVSAGRPADGLGKTIAVSGTIDLTGSHDGLTLQNVWFKQLAPGTADISFAALACDDLTLHSVKLDMNGSGNDFTTDTNQFGMQFDNCQNLRIYDPEVTGNTEVKGTGIGTGMFLTGCNGFHLIRPYLHDIRYVQVGQSDDTVQGIHISVCDDFVIEHPRIERLGRTADNSDRDRFSRGIAIGGSRGWIITGPRITRVDQAIDLSGSNTNQDWCIIGGVSDHCYSYGFKASNSAINGTVNGLVAAHCGLAGFTAAASTTNDHNLTQSITFNGCIARNIGSSLQWGNTRGFLAEGNANDGPQNIFWNGCQAISDIGSFTFVFIASNTFRATGISTAATMAFSTGTRIRVSTDGTLPTGLAAATDYWLIIDPGNIGNNQQQFKLASSYINAQDGTAVAISGAGSGTHTLTYQSDMDSGFHDDTSGTTSAINRQNACQVIGATTAFNNFKTPTYTISGGGIVLKDYGNPQSIMLAGEGGVADNFDTITGGFPGQVLILQAVSDSVDITIVESGNIRIPGTSFVLDTTSDRFILVCEGGSTWKGLSTGADNV